MTAPEIRIAGGLSESAIDALADLLLAPTAAKQETTIDGTDTATTPS